MIKEAIEYIAGLGTAENSVELTDLPGRQVLVKKGRDYETVSTPPRDINADVYDFESLIDIEKNGGSDQVCYVDTQGHNALRLFKNKSERFEHYTYSLTLSNQYSAFRDLSQMQTPKQLVRFLKTQLHDCLTDSSVLPAISKIDFRRKNDGHHANSHGKESLGRAIEMEVQAPGGNLPEIVVFEITKFSNPQFRVPLQIRCVLDFDFDNEKVSITPIGDELELFKEKTKETIRKRLNDTLSCEVYSGWCNSGD